MERSSLVELIRTLQPEERQEFDHFLSNFCLDRKMPGEETIALFRHIQYALKEPNKHLLDKSQAYQAIFDGIPVIKGKLEKVMVDLNKLLRQFLQIRHYLRQENAFQQQLDLASVYQGRGLQERYLQLLTQMNQDQALIPWKNTDYFFRQFQLEFSLHEYQSIFNRKKSDLNIPAVLHHLDIFYYLNRLDLLNYFLLQCRMTNLEVSDEIGFAMQETPLPQRYLKESGILRITYKFYLLLRQEHPQPADFQEMAGLLKEHEPNIEPAKLEQFYTYLRNLCVMLINTGQDEFWPILHHIQRDNLQRGFLYHKEHQGKLTPSAFLNLVSVALHVGQTEWVGTFLESHQERIIGDNETADFFRLNRACYLFARGQYEQALDDIPPSSSYLDYHLMARRLEVKIYFELQSDLLPYKVDAFKMLVSRMSKKYLSPILRRRNANFINLALQLLQSAPGDRKRAEKIRQRIRDAGDLVERQWLLEKAGALC